MDKYSEARKFDKELYDKTDDSAKELMKSFLIKRGHTIIKEEEDYEHDLVTSKDGKEYYFELELNISGNFNDVNDFKYSSVSFLGRKLRLHNIKPFYYVIICPTTGGAFVEHSSKIYQDKYKVESKVDQPHRKGFDCFYRVPKNEVNFFNVNKI